MGKSSLNLPDSRTGMKSTTRKGFSISLFVITILGFVSEAFSGKPLPLKGNNSFTFSLSLSVYICCIWRSGNFTLTERVRERKKIPNEKENWRHHASSIIQSFPQLFPNSDAIVFLSTSLPLISFTLLLVSSSRSNHFNFVTFRRNIRSVRFSSFFSSFSSFFSPSFSFSFFSVSITKVVHWYIVKVLNEHYEVFEQSSERCE